MEKVEGLPCPVCEVQAQHFFGIRTRENPALALAHGTIEKTFHICSKRNVDMNSKHKFPILNLCGLSLSIFP